MRKTPQTAPTKRSMLKRTEQRLTHHDTQKLADPAFYAILMKGIGLPRGGEQ